MTAALKNTWNAKYTKPSAGIPKTDLASAVQTALMKAESALTSLPTHAYTHKTGGADALTASDIGAAPAKYVTTQSFTASVGGVSASSNSSTSVSVALTGYTPVLVGTVYSKGNNSSGLPAAYRVVALSLSGSTVNLTLGATMNMISDTVTVGFTVLYTKNS